MTMMVHDKIQSLSVVIPVLNEEKIIEESLTSLQKTLELICQDYEIIVVDDGSTDNTPSILQSMIHKMPTLRVLRNLSNIGLGGALRRGFEAAAKELVFYVDADMPFDYGEIVRAVRTLELNRADVVAGFRKDRGQEPFVRTAGSLIYNQSVRLLYNIALRDINCAFKLIKTSVLRCLDLKAQGSFIDAELMVRTCYLGHKITELEVSYRARQASTSRLFRPYPIMMAFLEMGKLYGDIRRLKTAEG